MEDKGIIIGFVSDYCKICQGLKMCKVFHFDEDDNSSMNQICDPTRARELCIGVENNTICDVWCMDCGIKYHPNSVISF